MPSEGERQRERERKTESEKGRKKEGERDYFKKKVHPLHFPSFQLFPILVICTLIFLFIRISFPSSLHSFSLSLSESVNLNIFYENLLRHSIYVVYLSLPRNEPRRNERERENLETWKVSRIYFFFAYFPFVNMKFIFFI